MLSILRLSVQVGDLLRVLNTLEQEPESLAQLRANLKIPDEARWKELVQVVRASVPVDNRVRAFSCPVPVGELLLLFPALQGRVDFGSLLGLYCPTSPNSNTYVYALITLPGVMALSQDPARFNVTAVKTFRFVRNG
jgi:hypothetical protein